MTPTPDSCPVCAGPAGESFFSLAGVAVNEGYLAPTPDGARGVTRGDIELVHCNACGHVWNRRFDPDLLRFDPAYDISMFHSQAYRDYIDASLARLIRTYNLSGKTALEIACGKGDFLRALVRSGFSRAIGFDPTFDDAVLDADDRKSIEAHRDYYGPAHANLRTDLVAARSVMQYFPRPRPFLQQLRQTLDTQRHAIVYAEVPNGSETFEKKLVWNVVYEHGCFFNRSSLSRAFRDCGFDVLYLTESLGGSQLEIEARPSPRPAGNAFDDVRHSISLSVNAFADEVRRKQKLWDDRLSAWRSAGRVVALWGAGARSIGMMQLIPRAADIGLVVDINPKRQGKHLPVTAQPVIDPAALAQAKPDIVIATNPNFAKEIEQQVRDLGLKSEFLSLD
jgi:SAM-dependent methyltransferase